MVSPLRVGDNMVALEALYRRFPPVLNADIDWLLTAPQNYFKYVIYLSAYSDSFNPPRCKRVDKITFIFKHVLLLRLIIAYPT